MGVGYSNPQFTATNYVLDYSINLLHPDRYGQVMQRLGPNINNFPGEGRNKVLSDFNESLQSANPALAAEYAKYRTYTWIMFVLIIIGVLSFVLVPSMIGGDSSGYILGWIICLAAFIGGIVGICVVSVKTQAIARQWRTEIIENLQPKMATWAAMYPQFTFTIIWPVEVWRRSGGKNRSRRLVAIWCYVRVTQGPCTTGFNEPIYATTTSSPQTVQPVVHQQVQQQPQSVMIQGPNGQMVEGTPAIVNGQNVVLVQQPPPNQGGLQQPVYQQQMGPQYVYQPPSYPQQY